MARPMADHELTPDEAIRGLAELFSNLPSAPKRRCRKYFLEYQDGEPVFRLAEIPSKPSLPRDDFDVIFDEVMIELFGSDPNGDEIVPQKLAKLFTGSLTTADR
jgi:hypothetical protein